jgi:hypothetical protein
MRIATTIAKDASGNWLTLATGEDIDRQLKLVDAITDAAGIYTKGKVELQLQNIFVLTSSRPIAIRKFK